MFHVRTVLGVVPRAGRLVPISRASFPHFVQQFFNLFFTLSLYSSSRGIIRANLEKLPQIS